MGLSPPRWAQRAAGGPTCLLSQNNCCRAYCLLSQGNSLLVAHLSCCILSTYGVQLSALLAGVVCTWEHVSGTDDGWSSTEAFQWSRFLCYWEVRVAQEGKRYSDLQTVIVRGFRLTSGSHRRLYPAWERLGGTMRISLFPAFLSLYGSSPFLHPVDWDESCMHPSASFLIDPIKIPNSCSICEGWAVGPVQLEGYSPGALFLSWFWDYGDSKLRLNT